MLWPARHHLFYGYRRGRSHDGSALGNGWPIEPESALIDSTFMPHFRGEAAESPRREFFYFSDNADLMALRCNAWKISFKSIKGNLFNRLGRNDQRSMGDQSARGPMGALSG